MLDEADAPPPSDIGAVELSVPLQARHAATVRTMAATLGADAGFSVDELDDIRLALSEVFSALAEGAEGEPAARASVVFSIADGTARIEVRTGRDGASVELDELALNILRSVTDDFDVTPTTVVLIKHATEANADLSTS